MQLIDEPQNLKTNGAAFGPDGRWIWFSRRTSDWQYNAMFPQYQLAVYDRDTGEIYGRSGRYGSGIRPTLSPDGRWLVYGTRHESQTGLIIRDLNDGSERWLAYPVQHDDQESRASRDALPGMSFTPDSERLITTWGGRIWSVPVAGGEATEIPFRVRFDLEMGPRVDFDYPISDSPRFALHQIRNAVPSPDGSRVAFTALDRVYVAAIDGSDPTPLTEGAVSEHFPVWSPDGSWIAYVTWEGEEGHVYKIRSNGNGDPQRLTTAGGIYAVPAWSPAGDRIVALRGDAQNFRDNPGPGAVGAANEMVWIPADGGAATLVTPIQGQTQPHFTADPERIYYYTGGALTSIRWDGTDTRSHLRVRGQTPAGSNGPLNASSILMAPVGDQALAVVQNHTYVVTVPRVGGDAITISVSNPDNAQFPARKLTDIGGEFPAWSADGRTVHFSLGNALFAYDLDAAEAADEAGADETDEAEQEEGDEEDEATQEEGSDEADGYRASESRIEILQDRDIPDGAVVLTGARVVTMRGDEVIENGEVVVRNNRIAAVGAAGAVDRPSGAEVIDVSGKTIVPGFVDTHAHMRPSFFVHKKQPWIFLANLAYGVTTTRDPQTGTTDVLTYGDMVTAGQILGPRIYSTGPGVFWQDNISSLEEARSTLRRYSEYFDTKTIKMYVSGNRQERQWIIEAARELRLMPTTEGSLNLKLNLTETIDGYPGLEHTLSVFPLYDDVIQLFAASGRTYTPTLLVAYGGPWTENLFYESEEVHDDEKLRRFTPHSTIDGVSLRRPQWFRDDQYVHDDHSEFITRLIDAGGKAGVGSHGQLQGLGYHWELMVRRVGWAVEPRRAPGGPR